MIRLSVSCRTALPSAPSLFIGILSAVLVLAGGAGCRHAAPAMSAPPPPPPPPPPIVEAERARREAEVRARREAEQQSRTDAAAREARMRAEQAARAAQPADAAADPAQPDREFDLVRVFFATDRKATGEGLFGGERGAGLSYGSV